MSIKRVSKSGITIPTTQNRSTSLLVISGVPGSPTSVSASPTSVNSATVTWVAPSFVGEAPITSYVVEGGGSVSITGTTATVTGLSPNTSYTFTVQAVNSVGGGSKSPANSIITPDFNNATGGTITTATNYNGTSDTYRIHTFTSSGTFTVSTTGNPFRVLVNGAGGAGGGSCSPFHGGGGDGGYGTDTLQTLSAQAYTVTIGQPNGGTTSLGSVVSGAGGAGGGFGPCGGPNSYSGTKRGPNSNIRNGSTVVNYGDRGIPGENHFPATPPANTGKGGDGRNGNNQGGPTNGASGIAIIAYRIS